MRRYFFSILFVLAAAAQAFAETSTIHCPAEPPFVRRLQLQERWRIDPADSDAPMLGLFDQSQVFVHNGRVYMLDRQMCHILIYSDDGEFLGTIMREGDGPGEVRDPGAMFLCSGERIAVQHGYPTKLEFVALDGTPRGRWRLEPNAWVMRLYETPLGWFSHYTESKQSKKPGVFSSIYHVALHDDEGRITDEYYRELRERNVVQGGKKDEAEEFLPWHTSIPAGDGRIVYAAARDQYRIEWRDLSGEVTRVVTRDFKAHRRTEDELDRLEYRNYTVSNGKLMFGNRRLCDHDPMIRSLTVLPDGGLRVITSLFEADLPDGMVCRYEVHEPAGDLRERIEIYDPTGDYDVEYDNIVLLDDGRAMILRNLRPAFRAAYDSRLHPDLVKKLPPVPDDRDDVGFAPIMCDLVPYPGIVE